MKRRLHIIGTGGTIAGVSRGTTRPNAQGVAAYDAGVLRVDALLHGLPIDSLREQFALSSEQLVNIDSKDMSPEVWWRLAQHLQVLAQDPDVQGVVITHGTDTLEETSFFIDCLRQCGVFTRTSQSAAPLGIVFAAAMRPADAPDADGPQNLCDALAVAAHEDAGLHGVMCVLQGRIHSALYVNKVHSTAIDAFSSAPNAAIGKVHQGQAEFVVPAKSAAAVVRTAKYPRLAQRLASHSAVQWPWVALVTCHADIDARVVSGLISAGVKGLVVACTGNGTIASALLPVLREAVKAGVVVRRASRVSQGGVHAYPGDEFESSGELSAVKARISLMMELVE